MLDASQTLVQKLPDVASGLSGSLEGVLDAVGMSGVEVPVNLLDQKQQLIRTPAKVDAFVNLNQAQARGIHMSRLFSEIQSSLGKKPLSLGLLADISAEFLKSHAGLSDRAEIAVSFEALLERKALKSSNFGWRSYPVKLSASRDNTGARFFVEVLVAYSSTCPASAALARQLIQQNFERNFTEPQVSKERLSAWLGTTDGINATPHAQRSFAKLKIQVKDLNYDFVNLIDLVENSLQTPVQTMVKREDEQEFALRNGQNLMFCEDAARRLQRDLDAISEVIDYEAEFRHVESLHPHDAVARIRKQKPQ